MPKLGPRQHPAAAARGTRAAPRSYRFRGDRRLGAGRFLPLALCLAAAGSGALFARYGEKDFRSGVDFLERRQYAKAAEAFRRAIEQDGAEKDKLVPLYGTRFAPYLPHFYLGQALEASGDCAGAVEQWQLSLQQGVVRSQKKELPLLREGMDRCRPQLADVDKSPPDEVKTEEETKPSSDQPTGPSPEVLRALAGLDAALERAERAQSAFAQARAQLAAVGSVNDLAAGAERAERDLESARRGKVAPPAARVDAVEQAKASADRATQAYQDLAERARTSTQQVQRELDQLRGQLRSGAEGAGRLLQGSSLSSPEARRLQESARAARVGADGASTAEAQRLAADLAAARSAFEALQSRSKGGDVDTLPGGKKIGGELSVPDSGGDQSAPPEPPGPSSTVDEGARTALLAAGTAFYGGDYARAVTLLDGAPEPTAARGRLARHLLRAAARYALFLAGGSTEQELVRQAATDIAACRRIDPALDPTALDFSPGFARFYQQQSSG